jgi:hypothetical protein
MKAKSGKSQTRIHLLGGGEVLVQDAPLTLLKMTQDSPNVHTLLLALTDVRGRTIYVPYRAVAYWEPV